MFPINPQTLLVMTSSSTLYILKNACFNVSLKSYLVYYQDETWSNISITYDKHFYFDSEKWGLSLGSL